MWEIYAYQNADSLFGIFNAAATIHGSGDYMAAVAAVAFCGFIAALVAYAFAPEKLQGWKWLATVLLVFSVLIVPRVTVGVVDKTGGSAVKVVANVPFGVAFLGSVTSTVGHTLTGLFETAFQVIPGVGALRPEDHETLPDNLSGPALERAAALALREHRDDETLRLAIVLQASPREVQAQLATGETVVLSGDGLRWAQPGLAPKAASELVIRRGSVIRVARLDSPNGKAAAAAAPTRCAIAQWPEAQAALVSMDPRSGRVRAWVGGFDFRQQPFDHVSQAWRQPGSSFKPFLYSAALEHGVMPATLILDAPLTGAATEGGWDPQNSDGQFDGPLTLRQALVKSKNLVSIRLLQFIGLGPVRDWIARFGFDLAKQPDNLTLALGAGSTTPLQMAQAYAVLANGGQRVAPVVIERITDAKGQLLFEAPKPGDGAVAAVAEPVVPARNLFITNSLLNDVTRIGTAAKAQAQLNRSDLYGKTGTTNDAVDAWFAGYQPGLVAVVWMGHDEPRSLGERESGGGLALPIWINYMRQALAGVPVVPPPAPPEGVVRWGDDWVYSEWAGGGYVQRIGLPEPVAEAASAASAPAAASAAVQAVSPDPAIR